MAAAGRLPSRPFRERAAPGPGQQTRDSRADYGDLQRTRRSSSIKDHPPVSSSPTSVGSAPRQAWHRCHRHAGESARRRAPRRTTPTTLTRSTTSRCATCSASPPSSSPSNGTTCPPRRFTRPGRSLHSASTKGTDVGPHPQRRHCVCLGLPALRPDTGDIVQGASTERQTGLVLEQMNSACRRPDHPWLTCSNAPRTAPRPASSPQSRPPTPLITTMSCTPRWRATSLMPSWNSRRPPLCTGAGAGRSGSGLPYSCSASLRCHISVRSDQWPPAPASGHGSWHGSVSSHQRRVSGSAATEARSASKSSPWYSKYPNRTSPRRKML